MACSLISARGDGFHGKLSEWCACRGKPHALFLAVVVIDSIRCVQLVPNGTGMPVTPESAAEYARLLEVSAVHRLVLLAAVSACLV